MTTQHACRAVIAALVMLCMGAHAAEPTPADAVTLRIVVEGVDRSVHLGDRSALRPVPLVSPSKRPSEAMPVPIIDGPATAEPGDLVVLSAERASGDAMCWVSINVDAGRYLEIDNGRRLVFATGKPGRYSFVLVAASLIEGQVVALTARHDVVIGGEPDPPPPPPPPPGPEPQPEPLPDGRFKLAAAAHSWAGQIPAAARSKASALAGAFDSVAAQIAAGVLTDFEQITPAMRSAKDAALGPDAAAWTPFFESLDSKLGQLWDAEQLTTVADMADAFRELATGLRAVQTGSTAR